MPKLPKTSKSPSKPSASKSTPTHVKIARSKEAAGKVVLDETKPQYNRAMYIDPGDRYIGLAIFEHDEVGGFWECTAAATIDCNDPEARANFEDVLASRTARGELDILGYEVWRLYEDKAQEQKGSEFLATQLIGVIKHLARRHAHQNRWPRQPLELVRFLPDHKKAVAGIMKRRGYKFMSRELKTFGDHAWDAELQGIYDLEHNRGYKVK